MRHVAVVLGLLAMASVANADALSDALGDSCRTEPRLDAVAADAVAHHDPIDAIALRDRAEAEGVAAPSVRAWIGRGDARAVARLATEWLEAQREPFAQEGARCGTSHTGDTWALVLVPRLAEIEAAPTGIEAGTVVHFDVRLPPAATNPMLLVMTPDGRVVPSPSGDVRFDRDGVYGLQWIATTERGPLPFATWHARIGARRSSNDGRNAPSNTFQLFATINRARGAAGVAPLRRDPLLDAIANERARTLAALGAVEHGAATGDSPVARLIRSRVGADRVAENVARARSLGEANARLESSPSHRANRLDPALDAVGFGIAELGDDVYLVELYATRPRIEAAGPNDETPRD